MFRSKVLAWAYIYIYIYIYIHYLFSFIYIYILYINGFLVALYIIYTHIYIDIYIYIQYIYIGCGPQQVNIVVILRSTLGQSFMVPCRDHWQHAHNSARVRTWIRQRAARNRIAARQRARSVRSTSCTASPRRDMLPDAVNTTKWPRGVGGSGLQQVAEAAVPPKVERAISFFMRNATHI